MVRRNTLTFASIKQAVPAYPLTFASINGLVTRNSVKFAVEVGRVFGAESRCRSCTGGFRPCLFQRLEIPVDLERISTRMKESRTECLEITSSRNGGVLPDECGGPTFADDWVYPGGVLPKRTAGQDPRSETLQNGSEKYLPDPEGSNLASKMTLPDPVEDFFKTKMRTADPAQDIFRTKMWAAAGSVQEIFETNFSAADPATGFFKTKFWSTDSVQDLLGSLLFLVGSGGVAIRRRGG
jgi:hypothetical protein